ncbi:MAG: YdeI/OmpD-associated family protein [Saprospiraceae bacterium]|nr:YdeI/OmpD-associated family protein [Saprospiraceae bacterium]
MAITTNPNLYFTEGCGRCELGGTPNCKVHKWHFELAKLRQIILDCGLHEEAKWGSPCYMYQNKNVLLLGAFKESCVISFIKGALLQDEHKILSLPGENSQATRWVKFSDVQEVVNLEDILKEYIFEAIEVEKAGLKVAYKKTSEYEIPEELSTKFDENPAFKSAFEALTPGRQRGYLLHFTQTKNSATRTSRIEKCMPKIFAGKGHLDYEK